MEFSLDLGLVLQLITIFTVIAGVFAFFFKRGKIAATQEICLDRIEKMVVDHVKEAEKHLENIYARMDTIHNDLDTLAKTISHMKGKLNLNE